MHRFCRYQWEHNPLHLYVSEAQVWIAFVSELAQSTFQPQYCAIWHAISAYIVFSHTCQMITTPRRLAAMHCYSAHQMKITGLEPTDRVDCYRTGGCPFVGERRRPAPYGFGPAWLRTYPACWFCRATLLLHQMASFFFLHPPLHLMSTLNQTYCIHRRNRSRHRYCQEVAVEQSLLLLLLQMQAPRAAAAAAADSSSFASICQSLRTTTAC
mmetsp:Transcript_213/g.472  ORF Transcript_213/g.472 Transcript_213/m.472 type:complete len:212 (+) Transcript_213:1522-2157(+)